MTKRIISLLVAVLMCFNMTGMYVSAGEEALSEDTDEMLYDTHGVIPSLPLEGQINVASIDYYYEEKSDALPGLHGGIDMICPTGTEVMAVYSGTVVSRGASESSYGYNIILEHKDPSGEVFYSRYAHLKKYKVSVGDTVEQGQVIALSGNTGKSTTPHLHLEIYRTSYQDVDQYERSYTAKYLLSLGVEDLMRMRFYYHPICGKYNLTNRKYNLGYGASCFSRCGLETSHNHKSRYADYLELFYERSSATGLYYYFDESAEERLFECETLREYIYAECDLNSDGHLSYYEMMRVESLDLRGLDITSTVGLENFPNLRDVLMGELPDTDVTPDTETPDTDAPDTDAPDTNAPDTDAPDTDAPDTEDIPPETEPVLHQLTVNYKIPKEYTADAGLLGLWKHIDTQGGLNLWKEPEKVNKAGAAVPPGGTFVVTEVVYIKGKARGFVSYNGVEGWCDISNSAWTEQQTSGVGKYTTDRDGYLIYTATGERVRTYHLSDATSDEFMLHSDIRYRPGIDSLLWSYAGELIYSEIELTEIVEGLLTGNMTITLTAKLAKEVYTVDVHYKVPEKYKESIGMIGLWKHTDTETNLTLREGPGTGYDKVGRIPPSTEMVITEIAVTSKYIWGKTTYDGVSGWCALDPSWAEQILWGVGEYAIDAEGHIVHFQTKAHIGTTLYSYMVGADLAHGGDFDFLIASDIFAGWMLTADGDMIYSSTRFQDIFPELDSSDCTVELYAYIIEQEGTVGDANGDGKINEADVTALLEYISGYRKAGMRYDLFDINGDGKINNRDLIALRQMIAA